MTLLDIFRRYLKFKNLILFYTKLPWDLWYIYFIYLIYLLMVYKTLETWQLSIYKNSCAVSKLKLFNIFPVYSILILVSVVVNISVLH